jgi:hypothetical protein
MIFHRKKDIDKQMLQQICPDPNGCSICGKDLTKDFMAPICNDTKHILEPESWGKFCEKHRKKAWKVFWNMPAVKETYR